MLVSGELRYGSRVETVAGESSNGGWLDGLGHLRVDLVELSDRLMVLNHGKVIANGPPREVVRQADVISAYLGAGAASS